MSVTVVAGGTGSGVIGVGLLSPFLQAFERIIINPINKRELIKILFFIFTVKYY